MKITSTEIHLLEMTTEELIIIGNALFTAYSEFASRVTSSESLDTYAKTYKQIKDSIKSRSGLCTLS